MEVKKLKHVCRFCEKSFPCGRSLGGHIRSHLPKPGYELRENPKKTWRAADHGDVLLNSSFSSSSNETENPKLSKNQGKRSTFARNNSHSSVSEVVEAEQQEEVVVAMCLIMLSQDVGSWGDDTSSSFATAADSSENIFSQGNSSKSRRRKEKVQRNNCVSGAASDKKYQSASSVYLQKGLKLKGIEVASTGFGSSDQNNKSFETKKKTEKSHGKDSDLAVITDHVSKTTKAESSATGYVKSGLKIKEFEVAKNGVVLNDEIKQSPESKRKIGQITNSGNVKKGSKMEEFEESQDGIDLNDQKHTDQHEIMDSEFCNDISKSNSYKRSKFECTTCNKVFHSYQALGGHRASHKKLLGGLKCSPPLSKLEEIENPGSHVSMSPDDQKQVQPQQEVEEEVRIGSSSSTSSKKVVQKHECPICYRVFPSGQALGGHKRSHLLVAPNADINGRISQVKINDQSSSIAQVVERLSSTETRDLLDLNFPPAPVQDETTTTTTTVTTPSSSSNSLVGLMKPYWCVENSHKHEPLLGLISN